MARIKCDHCNGTIVTYNNTTAIRSKNEKRGGVIITWSNYSDNYEEEPKYFYICNKCSDELFKFLTKGIEEDSENGK